MISACNWHFATRPFAEGKHSTARKMSETTETAFYPKFICQKRLWCETSSKLRAPDLSYSQLVYTQAPSFKHFAGDIPAVFFAAVAVFGALLVLRLGNCGQDGAL